MKVIRIISHSKFRLARLDNFSDFEKKRKKNFADWEKIMVSNFQKLGYDERYRKKLARGLLKS